MMRMLYPLLLIYKGGVWAAPLTETDMQLVLVGTGFGVESMDHDLTVTVNQPIKGSRVLRPTERWETWAVFAYNSVVNVGPNNYRMYYDCIEGTGVPPGQLERGDATTSTPASTAFSKIGISHRRICLAESTDGLTWVKPNVGIFNYNGSTANNILLEDSGVSVFLDANPAAPSSAKWKMACSNAAYGSPDGLAWTKLVDHSPVKAEDDTKPTAGWDPIEKKYIIYVRRDAAVAGKSSDVVRSIGRCSTDDFTNWEKESPGGCPIVFTMDGTDPDKVDIYTNAWTPYPSVAAPAAHFFFPSMYHHFSGAPWGFGNDGLLDLRLAASRTTGAKIEYIKSATNARSPFVPLGVNLCGADASTPQASGGWCSPTSGIEANISFDTSAMYMADGWIPSNDGTQLYLYSSGQPFTHGGDAGNHLWGNNSGIRVLTLRKDGFASVNAGYSFDADPAKLPSVTTHTLTVPKGCPPPMNSSSGNSGSTGCGYEHPENVCPADMPAFPCKTDADCKREDKTATCKGNAVHCAVKRGVCSTGLPGGDLCVGKPSNTVTGGVQLLLNVETSVAGYAQVGLTTANGDPIQGFSLAESLRVKGNTVGGAASWGSAASRVSSVSGLAGQQVNVTVALADAKLYSLRFGCGGAAPPSSGTMQQ